MPLCSSLLRRIGMFYFKDSGETFAPWEIRILVEFLRVEGFWNVSGMQTRDVIYWAENHSHRDAKTLVSIGRVDV